MLVCGQPVLELEQQTGAPINQIHVTIPDAPAGTKVFDGLVRHLPPGTALPPPARSLLDRVGIEPITRQTSNRPVSAVQIDGYDLAIIEQRAVTIRVAIYDQEPARPFLRAEYYLPIRCAERHVERDGLDAQPSRVSGLGR